MNKKYVQFVFSIFLVVACSKTDLKNKYHGTWLITSWKIQNVEAIDTLVTPNFSIDIPNLTAKAPIYHTGELNTSQRVPIEYGTVKNQDFIELKNSSILPGKTFLTCLDSTCCQLQLINAQTNTRVIMKYIGSWEGKDTGCSE